jgi:Flp pilus assembly protein TadG
MNVTKNKKKRIGAVAVEMALVIPIVLLVFLGLWEWSRVEMIKHVCKNAVFVGARHGTLPGSTETNTEQKVQDILDIYFVEGATIDATIDLGTGASTVNVTVPIDSNVTLGYAFFAGKQFSAEMTLIK